MPTYQSKCLVCGTSHDYLRKVDERNDVPLCCGKPTERCLTTPMIGAMCFTGHQGFHIPDGKNGKGTWIESGQDYKKYLKATNGIPGPEGKAESARIIAAKEVATKAQRRKDVESVVNKMM